jgi:hypothetical protein
VEGLEHEAEVAPAQARKGIVVEPVDALAGKLDLAAVDRLEASDAVEQGRFSGAGFADDGDALASATSSASSWNSTRGGVPGTDLRRAAIRSMQRLTRWG